MIYIRRALIFTPIALLLIAIVLALWLFNINREIQHRIQGGWFKPPIELYTGGQNLRQGQDLTAAQLIAHLSTQQARERFEGQALYPNDYTSLSADQCREILVEAFDDSFSDCVYFRTAEYGPAAHSQVVLFVFEPTGKVQRILTTEPSSRHDTSESRQLIEREKFALHPQLFAQYYGGEPILRNVIEIGDAPIECLHATMAIEDSQFLEHQGISFKGLLRAMARNLKERRFAQGGSTITQQLVKNYFLTSERTLRRKFVEFFMALLLEANVEKDEILKNYLNITYMGQNGSFQVVGFGAAAQHFYRAPLSSLNLPQCALLAAIINSPGRYNPFRNPENAKKRRALVLDRMTELNLISSESASAAKEHPLPTSREAELSEPAPYFTQAIFRELRKLDIDIENQGLKIFTSLDPQAQEVAQVEVLKHVQWLEKENKSVKKNKAEGKNLEAALISIDITSGDVLALVGGRQFRKTQYNHILDAHRQVGSIMKPFVFLAALENTAPSGEPYDPMTELYDVPFTHSYAGQKWTPKNYTKKHYGKVPLYFALKNSLNISTAKLALDVGLTNIIDVARRAGIQSPMEPLPSLALGSFELYPKEVAEAYLTFARWGSRIPISFIHRVESLDGVTLYEDERQSATEFSAQKTAVLVGMMKETFRSGTARVAKVWGFDRVAAGKTGTTNDTKDAWFVGFTPHVLTVTWAGYGDNTHSGLTGASGALPLWVRYMNQVSKKYPDHDFQWPRGTKTKSFTRPELIRHIENFEENDVVDTSLIFEQ